MKILKSKWYLTKPSEDYSHRVVLVEYGGFNSSTRADSVTWQPVANGGGLMEKKPEFKGVLPVKGQRIIDHPKWYFVE